MSHADEAFSTAPSTDGAFGHCLFLLSFVEFRARFKDNL